jgi:hypothetical protein
LDSVRAHLPRSRARLARFGCGSLRHDGRLTVEELDPLDEVHDVRTADVMIGADERAPHDTNIIDRDGPAYDVILLDVEKAPLVHGTNDRPYDREGIEACLAAHDRAASSRCGRRSRRTATSSACATVDSRPRPSPSKPAAPTAIAT